MKEICDMRPWSLASSARLSQTVYLFRSCPAISALHFLLIIPVAGWVPVGFSTLELFHWTTFSFLCSSIYHHWTMTRPSQFISPTQMEESLAQLNQWLTGQAIKVPGGWVDACVEWLVDEHGGLDSCGHLTRDDWCRLVYEQWLHSDLRELSCPVLPSHLSPSGSMNAVRGGGAKCMKLEGELCLQVGFPFSSTSIFILNWIRSVFVW